MSALCDVDERAVRRRGGGSGRDDDHELVRCTRCGAQYLYNSEVLTLYLDPRDLGLRWLNTQGAAQPSCRGCGQDNWDFESIPDSELESARMGPWGWALAAPS